METLNFINLDSQMIVLSNEWPGKHTKTDGPVFLPVCLKQYFQDKAAELTT